MTGPNLLIATPFSTVPDLLMTGIVVGVIVLLIGVGYSAFFKKRLIENVPTSKCQGVTIGLNELKGRVNCAQPLTAYLSERQVVYYNYSVEEQWRKRTRSNGKTRTQSGWKTLDSGTFQVPFQLHDDTGDIRVHPEGAEFHGHQIIARTVRKSDPLYYGKGPRTSIANSTGRRRFRETIIANGAEAYVMGTVRVRDEVDVVAPEVAQDEFGEAFIISSKSEDELIKKFGWQSTGSFAGAFAAAVAGPSLFVALAFEGNVPDSTWSTVLILSIVLGLLVPMVIAGLYAKTIYNGLVDLRNRVRRAWAMLDVEFKRRHDLIPNLVNVVKSVASHERQVLESVVQARTNPNLSSEPNSEEARQVSQAIDQQTQGLQQLFAVAEAYPDLKSDGAFKKLMRELTRCEEKIALARSFYNDSVECVNNRVETFPDMLLAGLAGTQKEEFLSFEPFEKKPVKIDMSLDDEARTQPQARPQPAPHSE